MWQCLRIIANHSITFNMLLKKLFAYVTLLLLLLAYVCVCVCVSLYACELCWVIRCMRDQCCLP